MISTDTRANVIQDAASPHWIRLLASTPRTLAVRWLAVYLVVTALVLVARGHAMLALVHVMVISVAWWSASSEANAGRLIGDLLPLIAAALLYGEIPSLIGALGTGYHDVRVQGWEAALFGGQPSHTFASRMPILALSELLHAGYLSYYLVIFLPPLLLLVRGEREALGQTVLALTVTYTVCWVIFALWPVQGPRYLWAGPPAAPDGLIRRATLWILAEGSSRGAAFPSSHMAIAVVQTVMAFRWQRRTAWILAVVAGLIGVGAVYGGFHYGIDIVAGALLGGGIGGTVLSCFTGPSTHHTSTRLHKR